MSYLSEKADKLHARLDYLRDLEKGWYGPSWNPRSTDKTPLGEAVTLLAIDRARELLNRLLVILHTARIFPRMDEGDGLQFEWFASPGRQWCCELEVHNDGTVRYFNHNFDVKDSWVHIEFDGNDLDRVVEFVEWEHSKGRA